MNYICAIYIRKSRQDKDKPSQRLTVQREQLPTHARAQGWQIEVYDDGHASAARGKTDDLIERSRLENDIRAGRVNIILTIELSRLSRDDSLQDYVAWLHLCSMYRVKLATMSRILDPAQHSDWMLLLMEGGFSSVEMKILQARMKEGREQAKLSGKYQGGPPPSPYRSAGNGSLIVDPAELVTMQKLFSLAESKSARAAALQLGLPPIFARRAISDSRLDFYQAIRSHPETGELIPCDWPAIITSEQADNIKAQRATGRPGRDNRSGHSALFSNMGLIVCGYCGRRIRPWKERVRGDTITQPYYGCKGKEITGACPNSRLISQITLNEKIVTNLLHTLDKITECHGWWLNSKPAESTTDQIKTIIQKEFVLKTQKQRLIAAIADGVIDFADAKQKRQEIETALNALRDQRHTINTAEIPSPDWGALQVTKEEYREMTEDEKREVFRTAIKLIKMFRTYLLIEYKFPRTSQGETIARIHLPEPRCTSKTKKRP